MSRRFLELAVRARRFSFRLALMIDLACVGVGVAGGAAVARTMVAPNDSLPVSCAVALLGLAGFRESEQ
jgi:hypothetical protein